MTLLALIESMEGIPGELREALAYGYAAILEANINDISRRTAPSALSSEDEDKWVRFLMANNARAGIPISEEEIRREIRRHPRRYMNGIPTAPRPTHINNDELHSERRRMPGTDPNARRKRSAYYRAFIDILKKEFDEMGIELNPDDLYNKVMAGDAGVAHQPIPDRAATPNIETFRRALGNWYIQNLAATNQVFGKLVSDATNFMERANKARARGPEAYSEFIAMRKWDGPRNSMV